MNFPIKAIKFEDAVKLYPQKVARGNDKVSKSGPFNRWLGISERSYLLEFHCSPNFVDLVTWDGQKRRYLYISSRLK